jgi:molybdopterin-guanine dinucleotide biosynthesis protein A
VDTVAEIAAGMAAGIAAPVDIVAVAGTVEAAPVTAAADTPAGIAVTDTVEGIVGAAADIPTTVAVDTPAVMATDIQMVVAALSETVDIAVAVVHSCRFHPFCNISLFFLRIAYPDIN